MLDNSTTLSSNSATASGGGINDLGTLNLNGATITGNTAGGSGGGVSEGGTLNAGTATITGNSAVVSGGGIAVLPGGAINLTSTTIGTNTAGSFGGGIDNAGTATLNGATIMGNLASGAGGGLANEAGGVLTTGYSSFTGNSATSGGGGIDNAGKATITVATLSGNTAGSGGGIGNETGGTLTLTVSTISGNSAGSGGGGLNNLGGASLTNATLAANRGGNGGGISNQGTLTAINSTIAYNTVAPGGSGGGLVASGAGTTLYNTIVALNTSGAGSPNNAVGSLTLASSNNLFGQGGSGGLSAVNGNLINVKNPGLGSLANDGAPTQTIALLTGSLAIDAGSASIPGVTTPIVDQRGALRGPAGLNAGSNPDIGAYEASSSYQVNTATDSTAMGTLRAAIAWANVSTNANPANLAPNTPAPNTAAFDTKGAFSTPQTITISPTLGAITLSNGSQAGEAIDGTASNGLTISGGGRSQILSVAQGANVTLSGLVISGGSSTLSGGAITNSGKLAITDATITGNSAASGGGAIDNLGTLAIDSSTLTGNSAGLYGGAVDVESTGTFTATNSTIANNASAQGGGIYTTGTLTAINATMAYNTTTAAASGGGLNAHGGVATLYNTIVASNSDSAGGDPADDIGGSVVGSNNVIGAGGAGGLINGVDGNQVGVTNPGLAPQLGNNGGTTQTIALQSTSPAIGTGIPSAGGQTIIYDQRGALRGTTSIDVGSFELSSSYLVTRAQDSTQPGTLRSAIMWADDNSDTSTSLPLTITFDTQHVFATPQVISLGLGTMALTNTLRPIVIDAPGASMLTINGNGASGVLSVAGGVTLTISGATITGGVAAAGGGINNAGSLTLDNVALTNNTAPSGSGAAVNNTGTLTVNGSSSSGNSGSYYGGAIFNHDGAATITDSNFVGNSTLYGLGGAIDNLGGTLTVTGGNFQGNTSFQGGAIYNRDDATGQPGQSLPGTATLTGVTIGGNNAYQGGGVFNEGTMTVSSSTIANNTAFQGGAASNNFGGTMAVTNSTLAFNTAQQYGGAVDNVGALTMVSSTIAYNVVAAGGTGGGIDVYAGTAALYDTIAALNTVGSGKSAVANDITGQLASISSYNLIGAGGLVNGVNHNIVGVTKPGLASGLANNGGPTQTIALFSNSPALGAGSTSIAGLTIPAVDQRGVARPATGFDIGAYQGSIPAPVTTGGTASSSVIVASPLSAAVQAPAAASVAPLVSGTAPFHGRHLNSRAHRQAKATHPASKAHQSAHVASAARRTVNVRIDKHR
jgi:hypothetical protein